MPDTMLEYVRMGHMECQLVGITKEHGWLQRQATSHLEVFPRSETAIFGAEASSFDVPSGNQTWQWKIPYEWRFK